MLKRISARHRVAMALAVAMTVGVATYALTATNTVPSSYAGSGSGSISGYTVSNVQYQLDATSPANIDGVTFTLDAAATVAKAKVVASATTYTNCTIAGGVNVTCDLSPNVAVTAADQLSVIATS
jgi:hypothetical protein